MTAKHTPGPWELQRPLFGEQHIYVHSENTVNGRKALSGRQHICVVPYEGKKGAVAYHEMFNANARLIAAAPELLEAAKLVLEWYEAEDNHSGTDFYQRMQMCRDSEDAIRAAIAKATGEQT